MFKRFKRNHAVLLFFFAVVSIVLVNVCFGDVEGDLVQAEEFREAGRFAEAESMYKAIIAADANSEEAFVAQEGLGVIYVRMGNQTAADTAYQELLAKYSNRSGIANAIDHVADAYRMIGNFQKARACNQYIVDEWPDADHAADSQAGVVRASILMGDEIGAQAGMNTLLSSFADSTHIAKAVYDVSVEYRKAGQYEKSRQWHQYVVDHWPQDEYALEAQKGVLISNIVLGNQAASEGAVDKLISDYNINAEEIAEAIDNVGDDYRHDRNYTKANQLYQYIATSLPAAEYALEAQSDVVRCSVGLGDEASTQAAIDKLLSDFGGHKNAAEEVDQLADLFRERSDYIQARYLYQYIVTNWPNTDLGVNAQGRVADCCIILGDEAGTQAAYDKLLADFSGRTNLAEAVEHVANAYRTMGNCTKAMELYQDIASIWSTAESAVKVQSDLIRCSILLGDEAGAQAAYDVMLSAFSDHPRLPESMLFVSEEYIKRGVELRNSMDLVGAQRHYHKGLVILEKILNDFPSTSYAAEVCDWAAMCNQQLGNYQQSIYYNQKIVDDHPDYRMVSNALFWMGHNYEKLKESDALSESQADLKTKTAYEQLLEKYPGSQHAQYARNWLDRHNSN